MITTIKQLKIAYKEKKRIRYKLSVIDSSHLISHDYKLRTANGLTKAVIDWFNCSGGQAERINTTGLMRTIRKPGIQSKQIWTKSTGTKGSADISGILGGISYKIEVKIGHDRQSEAQKRYSDQVQQAGGVYLLVTSWDHFINQISNYQNINL